MKRFLIALLVALGLAGIGAPDVSPALAQTSAPSSSTSSEFASSSSASPGDLGPGTNSAAGVYAAIGCGLFSRALGGGLVTAGTIAGAIACCAFIFIDAAFF